MIDLYFWPTPNGWKITIMLEELGLPYTVIPVEIGKGDQFKPEFLAISPNNKMPAIVDPDGPGGEPISIFESGAIMIYLAEKTGKLMPTEPRGRVRVLEWLMFQMGTVGPMLGQAHHFRNYAPETIDYAVSRYTREAGRIYHVIDKRLEDNAYLAGEDYSIADIAVVYSHPQSLGQSRIYLEGTLGHARAIASLSNAQAVIDMQASDAAAGAIGPRRAAEIYGAEVIAEAIQDNPNNYTRFVVLDDTDRPPTGHDMTSVAFQFSEDEPGLLYRALGVLRENSINMVKIESRPTGERLGRYTFLIDMELHRADPVGRETIEKLRAMSSWFKVFGSYPRMEELPVRGQA